jgi:flagellar biogenesis protein FliO
LEKLRMRCRSIILPLALALLAGPGGAMAQQWEGPEASHYARGLSQPTAIAPASPVSQPPAMPPQPFRLVSGAEDIAPAAGAAGETRQPLRLAPRATSHDSNLARPPAPTTLSARGSVGGSLAVVLGLFLTIVWFSRKLSPPGQAPLPKEAVELLGRAPLGARQQMQLVRLGNKLVLLAVTATGAESLAEVTEPTEVERLTALCRRGQPGSSSAAFTQLLGQIGSEPAPRGFVGETTPRTSAAPTRR